MIMAVIQLRLASNSPRRRELLALTGWQFDVLPADIDETPRPAEHPYEYVLRLARSKAQACAALQPIDPVHGLILAADTTVADGDDLLGKPASHDEAVSMLTRLRGRTHQVYTAVAVLDGPGRMESAVCRSDVPMRAYTADEMEAYIATGDPFDKAGGYAIQNRQFHPVENFQGCFCNVMGLPLCTLKQLMQAFGHETPLRVPPEPSQRNALGCAACESFEHRE